VNTSLNTSRSTRRNTNSALTRIPPRTSKSCKVALAKRARPSASNTANVQLNGPTEPDLSPAPSLPRHRDGKVSFPREARERPSACSCRAGAVCKRHLWAALPLLCMSSRPLTTGWCGLHAHRLRTLAQASCQRCHCFFRGVAKKVRYVHVSAQGSARCALVSTRACGWCLAT